MPLATPDSLRRELRRAAQLKGRQPDAVALAEVRETLAERPASRDRPDLLIEHLHQLNDRWGGLRPAHLVALAHEMNLPMVHVYEVASFYHHFELVREGESPAALTVRVCNGLSCEVDGARDLMARLPGLLGPDVRVVAAPCIGRCEQAPAVLVGQVPVPRASAETVREAVLGEAQRPTGQMGRAHGTPAAIGYEAYRAGGGYVLAKAVADGGLSADAVLEALDHSALRGLGGAGFPAGRKWRIVREQPA
ncbi:MAG TPA: NAD(P)H-dependent oxidoreductase subunit E, partial [Steroidobacteraceae bacterium]|nr:NAD(P)H-dependent oxidoreductase subunit E [Steroidobacteraceae bacterium]